MDMFLTFAGLRFGHEVCCCGCCRCGHANGFEYCSTHRACDRYTWAPGAPPPPADHHRGPAWRSDVLA